jgi:outer membrane autotransporter protein
VRVNDFNLKRGDRVVFLTAGQGVSGEFSTVTSDFTSNTILQPMIVYSPTDVALEMVQGSYGDYATSVGMTQNQIATAKGLDSVAFGTTVSKIVDFMNEQSLQDLPKYLDKIAPEEMASMFSMANSIGNIQMTNLENRMSDVRSGVTGFSGQRFALQGSLPEHQGTLGFAGTAGPKGKELKESKVVTQPQDETRWGFFVNGAGEFVDIESTGNAKGYDFQSGGITLGVDYRVSENFAVGLTVGYAHTGVDLTEQGSVSADAGRLGLYATVFAGGFYADAAVTGGYGAYDMRRSGVQGSAYGSSEAGELDVYVGAGYDFKFGGLSVGPFANFQYTYVDMDGFTEHGSLAPLQYDQQSNDSMRLTLGLKLTYDCKVLGHLVRPQVRVGWQHEFADTAPAVTAALGSGGSQFTVYGPDLGEDAVLVGAGFTVQISEKASAFLFYDGEFGRTNYQLNALSGGVRVEF